MEAGVTAPRIAIGSRVLTPVGPGTVQAIHEERGLVRLLRPRPMFVVKLDEQGHCSYFPYDDLAEFVEYEIEVDR